jgi:hypothetical protein
MLFERSEEHVFFSSKDTRWSWHAWQKHKKQSPERIFAGPSKKGNLIFLMVRTKCKQIS